MEELKQGNLYLVFDKVDRDIKQIEIRTIHRTCYNILGPNFDALGGEYVFKNQFGPVPNHFGGASNDYLNIPYRYLVLEDISINKRL